jgi:thioredoxin reductase
VQWNSVVEKFVGYKPSAASVNAKGEAAEAATGMGGDVPSVLQAVMVKDVKTGKVAKVEAAAAFVAIGHDPNTKMFKGLLDMDEQGYLKTTSHTARTSVEGIFAAGDVADKVYRQAVTSAGTGAMAALDAERWLSEKGLGISAPAAP